jgi:hypothetical protein
MYCILGFCSMMNVYRIINYLSARICPTSFNYGKGSKVPFHSCPKPHRIPFLKQGLSVEVQDTPWKAKQSDHSICLCSICSHLGILGR